MKTRNAVTTALVLTGRYDHPTDKLLVKGRDMWGNEKEETIPAVDVERLNRDVDAIMADLPKSDTQ